MTTDPLKVATRELRQRTQYLRHLTTSVKQFLDWLDVEMKKPNSFERGKRIAKACNQLEMANDHARLFGLPRKGKASDFKRRASGE